MLQKLRDKTSGWIASLILGLLIIPFAFVGVNEYMTGGTARGVEREKYQVISTINNRAHRPTMA